MEFLKTCQTNAQVIVRCIAYLHHICSCTDSAQGDFEAVAYQAFSVARSTTQPAETLRDWSPDQDISAVEAALRDRQLLVVRDATKPWLWLFTPAAAAVDKAGARPTDLPDLTGYTFQRELSYPTFLYPSMLTRSRRTAWLHQGPRIHPSACVCSLPHRSYPPRPDGRPEQSLCVAIQPREWPAQHRRAAAAS